MDFGQITIQHHSIEPQSSMFDPNSAPFEFDEDFASSLEADVETTIDTSTTMVTKNY